nr:MULTISPECIES: invasion associated locus B family protein [unclassified Rhizobium]
MVVFVRLGWVALPATFVVLASISNARELSGSVTPQTERFHDWSYRCAESNTAGDAELKQCEVVQVAKVKQGEEDVSILTLAIARTASVAGEAKNKASEPALLLTALVPLNVFLPAGFGMDSDNVKLFEGGYRNCNQAGCWVQQRLDAKMVAALQVGQAGAARIRLMNGQNVTIRFSLKGLTAALAKFKEQVASN